MHAAVLYVPSIPPYLSRRGYTPRLWGTFATGVELTIESTWIAMQIPRG